MAPKKQPQKGFDWKAAIQNAGVPIIAAVVLAVLAFLWALLSDFWRPPHAQRVTWVSGENAGIKIRDEERFIPWTSLLPELNAALMPKLFRDPFGYRFEVRDFYDKKNWVVKLFDADGKMSLGYGSA